jgi:hypothetical protein
VTYVTGSAPLFEISVHLEEQSLKRIINGFVWAGERVFADRQNPPNHGYLLMSPPTGNEF